MPSLGSGVGVGWGGSKRVTGFAGWGPASSQIGSLICFNFGLILKFKANDEVEISNLPPKHCPDCFGDFPGPLLSGPYMARWGGRRTVSDGPSQRRSLQMLA